MNKLMLLTVLAATVGLMAVTPVLAAQLLTNGGFETGNFTGWTVVDQAGGLGGSSVIGGLVSPISGFATAGPAGGSWYAITDQTGWGCHVFYQMFTTNPGDTVNLSWDMFDNDQSGVGPIVNPIGLDYTAVPNQHSRVDILAVGSSPFDTGAGVLQNFYLGVDPGPNPHPYTSYAADITSLVGGGGSFMLRFAEVDNQLFHQLGVDNVSIDASGGGNGSPELSTWMLLACSGLAGLVIRRRRSS